MKVTRKLKAAYTLQLDGSELGIVETALERYRDILSGADTFNPDGISSRLLAAIREAKKAR